MTKQLRAKPYIWGCWPKLSSEDYASSKKLFDCVGGNTGNFAFVEAVRRHTDAARGPWNWSVPLWPEIEKIIIPCANQLGQHCDSSKVLPAAKKAKCPMVAIGLGAQARSQDNFPQVHPSTLEWVTTIVEHAPNPNYPNISLRGPFTQKVLEHYGIKNKSLVLGCPSLFLSREKNLGEIIAKNMKKPNRICVLAGQPHWQHLKKVEPNLTRLVSQTKGAYLVQDPLPLIQIALGEAECLPDEVYAPIREYALPHLSKGETLMWFDKYARVFFDIDEWINFYKDFDFVIGPRIHGTILALQAGIPAACVAHDTRTLELCELMKIPYFFPSDLECDLTPEYVYKKINFDPVEFDKNRIDLGKRYIDFLENNELPVTDYLKVIVSH